MRPPRGSWRSSGPRRCRPPRLPPLLLAALLVMLPLALPCDSTPASAGPRNMLVLSTLDGAVLGLDAATGARVFEVPARPHHPAVSSWAAPGQPQYIPALNGALFRVHPETGVAEQVDDAFLGASAAASEGPPPEDLQAEKQEEDDGEEDVVDFPMDQQHAEEQEQAYKRPDDEAAAAAAKEAAALSHLPPARHQSPAANRKFDASSNRNNNNILGSDQQVYQQPPRDSQPRRPAIVLKHQHTEVTYIDADTGAVLRTVNYDSPAAAAGSQTVDDGDDKNENRDADSGSPNLHRQQHQRHARPSPSPPANPRNVILLSRTSVGVRVLDAATGTELANASLTHTTPSLMNAAHVCRVPGVLEQKSGSGDKEDASSTFTSLVDAERGSVTMLSHGRDRVLWNAIIETDIIDAHGLGSVDVVRMEIPAGSIAAEMGQQHTEPENPVSTSAADRPGESLVVGHDGSEKTDHILSDEPTRNRKHLHAFAKRRVRVRGHGDSKYAMLGDGTLPMAEETAEEGGEDDYDLVDAGHHIPDGQPPQKLLKVAEVGKNAHDISDNSADVRPWGHRERLTMPLDDASESEILQRATPRIARLLGMDKHVSFPAERGDGRPTRNDPRLFYLPSELLSESNPESYPSLLRDIYTLMAMSVALGVMLGVGLLVTARRVRALRARRERLFPSVGSSSTSSDITNVNDELSSGPIPSNTSVPSAAVTPRLNAHADRSSVYQHMPVSTVPPIPGSENHNASDTETSNGSSTNSGSYGVPLRSWSGWMKVGCLEVSSKLLGVGSHGTVVTEGRIMPGARRVAVKRLLRQFYESARAEISLLVELDEASPHVVRYFAMEEDAEFIYLALELCAGSLYDRVVSGDVPAPPRTFTGGPPPRFTWRALRQLMQGLSDLHQNNIVHCDLKPHNVLITREKFDVKLADVGLARRLEPERSSYNALSGAAGGVGTTGWRAPEVLSGKRQTRAVDIFSAGCIVSYVLTGGDHPFGPVVFERDGNIVGARSDLRTLFSLQIPEAVDVVKRMTAHAPGDRPSAAEVLEHPFFWTDAMKLAFLCDISDRLYDLRNEAVRYTELLDESDLARHCVGWPSRMPPDLMRELGRAYNNHSPISFLLRVVRNKRNHYSELSPALQHLLGPLPDEDSRSDTNANQGACLESSALLSSSQTAIEDDYARTSQCRLLDEDNFLTFFLRRVPYLLMCVYEHACNYHVLVNQSHFKRYGFKMVGSDETLSMNRLSANRHGATASIAHREGEQSDAVIQPSTIQTSWNHRKRYTLVRLMQLNCLQTTLDGDSERRARDCDIYCPEAGERWSRSLATGVFDVPSVFPEYSGDGDTGIVAARDAGSLYGSESMPVSPLPGSGWGGDALDRIASPPGFARRPDITAGDNGFPLSPTMRAADFSQGSLGSRMPSRPRFGKLGAGNGPGFHVRTAGRGRYPPAGQSDRDWEGLRR